MEIARPLSQLSGTNASSIQGSQDNENSISSDFETFLQMLTAQARYQDPLNPIDSAEYASQLAQFSSVEQAVQTNVLLESINDQISKNDLASSASWIGKQVKILDSVDFSGVPIDLNFDTFEPASHAELVVHDSSGNEVDRISLNAMESEVSWTGVLPSGETVPEGRYSFKVEVFSGETELATLPAYSYAQVTEVAFQSGLARFRLSNGNEVDVSQIASVR